MRIAYLNPSGQLGGAETSLRELLASIRNAAADWELWLVLGQDGPLSAQARELDVKVIVLPFPDSVARLGDSGNGSLSTLVSLLKAAWGTLSYRRRLAQVIESIQPDVIHTNGLKMHLLGAWARSKRTPLVWHIHDYVGKRRLMGRLLRLFRKACAVAVVNSKSVAADLRTLFPDLKIVPIYNAVNLKRFSPDGTKLDLDAMAGLPPAPPGVVRVGMVATFARWKGHKVFLQALARVSLEAPIRGYVIGGPIYQTDGSQRSLLELRQEASRLGLDGRVGFTGHLDDAAAAMRSLDIVVHASTEPEPFGMVIIEGMACGKAVIGSYAGGACELLVDGENALTHAPGDVAGLARQIARLASDEELRRHLGRRGRTMAERLYGGKRLARELAAVYGSVTGACGRMNDETVEHGSSLSVTRTESYP